MYQRRLVALFLVLCALALPLGSASALAAPAHKPLDLPAALLRPADIGQPGYQVQSLSSDTADSLAGHLQQPQLAHQLAAAGFIRRYQQTLATPVQTNPHQAGDHLVGSFIDEYRTIHGATQAFQLATGLFTTADIMHGQKGIGDQSLWTLTKTTNPDTGAPMDDLGLLVRVANRLVEVDVIELLNGEPPVAEVRALTAKVLKRIAAGGGPGLSQRVVRIDQSSAENTADGYFRLGRKDLAFLGEDAASAKRNVRWYGTATEGYSLQEQLGTGQTPTIVGESVLTYPDATHAAAAVHGWQAYSASIPGRANYKPVTSLGRIGDESVAFTYTVTDSQAGKTDGLAVVFRLGTTVYVVFARGPQAPTVAAMTTLVRDEVACAKGSTKACTLAKAPTGLTGS